ncbi:hypothetical protein BHE74_00008705 [Ensete ventricosum]|nr:hypothetical protein BHE74_00008705 [Ensete ventricosum]
MPPGNEAFERVATNGLTANFMVYLVEQYGMRQMEAATLCNVFSGTSNAAPLLGAFVSDAYWGRFRTLTYASLLVPFPSYLSHRDSVLLKTLMILRSFLQLDMFHVQSPLVQKEH